MIGWTKVFYNFIMTSESLHSNKSQHTISLLNHCICVHGCEISVLSQFVYQDHNNYPTAPAEFFLMYNCRYREYYQYVTPYILKH